MARLLAAGSEGEVYTAVLDQAQMEDEAGETMVCVKKPHLTGPEGLAAVFEVQQLPYQCCCWTVYAYAGNGHANPSSPKCGP